METVPRYTCPKSALSQVCLCGQRYRCGLCWGYDQKRRWERITATLKTHLHSGRVARHIVVEVEFNRWQMMLQNGAAALRHAGEVRRKQAKRKSPGPLAGIVYGAWHPHMTIGSGLVRPHFHGAVIIDAGHDPRLVADELGEVISSYGGVVSLRRGNREPDSVAGYLTHERLHDDDQWRAAIETVWKGKRWPRWRPITAQATAKPTAGRAGKDSRHLAWDAYWAAVAVGSENVCGPAWLEGIGHTPAARQRLAKLHRVIEAAHAHATASGLDSIELPVRRIADLIGTSKSTIQRHLSTLTELRIIEPLEIIEGNPAEYRYYGYQPTTAAASSDTTAVSHATG